MAKSEFSAKAAGIKMALNAIPKEHKAARAAVSKVLSEHRDAQISDLGSRLDKLSAKKSATKKKKK